MMTYEQLLQPVRFSRRGELSLLEATETDRARVVQSAPVRRLQQKTQVFPLDVKASVRSRLTHSLEVQQVGRQICRALLTAKTASELPEMPLLNLLEMACLLHDVGNPPFGHFGESVLREWLRHHLPTLYSRSLSQAPSALWLQTLLPDLVAFDGNAQSLRLVHSLQQMDLTYSLLATLIKVPQGIEDSAEFAQKIGYFYSERQLVAELRQTLGLQMGQRFPLVYLMEAADDLCYCIADLEDAVDRGLLNLFELQQYLTLAWSGEAVYLERLLAAACSSPDGFFPEFRLQLTQDVVQVVVAGYLEQEAAILCGRFTGTLLVAGFPATELLSLLRQLAQERIFRCREIEALELEGHAALSGVLDSYGRLLSLSRHEFTALMTDEEGARHALHRRLFHRLSRRHLDAYKRAVAELGSDAGEANELEWYHRVRLLIDYVTGMTDTYVQAEYRLLRGF